MALEVLTQKPPVGNYQAAVIGSANATLNTQHCSENGRLPYRDYHSDPFSCFAGAAQPHEDSTLNVEVKSARNSRFLYFDVER
jgi:hypothetical protein